MGLRKGGNRDSATALGMTALENFDRFSRSSLLSPDYLLVVFFKDEDIGAY